MVHLRPMTERVSLWENFVLIYFLCYSHWVITLWKWVWNFRWQMNCKSCFLSSQEEGHSEWKMMSYLAGQKPEYRGAAGVHTLPHLTAASPALRRKHSPWLCILVTPDPTVLPGVYSFYCTRAGTKAFPVRVSQIVTLSKLFPCSLGAFNTSQKWSISGCQSKEGSKAHRKSLLGPDLTWSGLLSFFMSSPAANISQWNASIWQYPEGEVDYCSSKLHTATEERGFLIDLPLLCDVISSHIMS